MRDVLVSDLVESLLGPRGGPEEEMKGNPRTEYITGILSPVGSHTPEDESGIVDSELNADSGSFAEDSSDMGTNMTTLLSPVLDPKSTPSTMGMSFYVKFETAPLLDICATWARYVKIGGRWKRRPRRTILRMDENNTSPMWIGADGNMCKKEDAEISIHLDIKRDECHASVSVYLVNRVRVDGSHERTSPNHHIFQPQLRAVCSEGTSLIPKSQEAPVPDEDREYELPYGDNRSFGRGHMVSVVWKDVDPEILCRNDVTDQADLLRRPGFAWVDGRMCSEDEREMFSEDEREMFSNPDIRTEFMPMYSVLAPNVDYWPPSVKNLDAKSYSELYDPEELRNALEPLCTAYGLWVTGLREIQVRDKNTKNRIVANAEAVHRRIRGGINFLCDDDDARLAFCFASRAMDMQDEWDHPKTDVRFGLRPFQLGFILLSVESTLNAKSAERNVCDLLWVPTGTGKTEAYLFLIAMTAAYRRLKAQKKMVMDRSGAGVSVISRYTLRLLTIQQFRRALKLFTAMECMRVTGLEDGRRVGWRPADFRDDQDFLWGTTRFSVGLWVGGKVTPNALDDIHVGGERIPGALSILKDPRTSYESEPAQVLDCPACGAILSLPQKGGPSGKVSLHYMVRVTGGSANADSMTGHVTADVNVGQITDVTMSMVRKHDSFFVLSVTLNAEVPLEHNRLRSVCRELATYATEALGIEFEYLSPESRPGYFVKKHNLGRAPREYDFEIFCPNAACPLNKQWTAGSPLGNANGKTTDRNMVTDTMRGMQSPDGNHFVDVNPAFEVEPHVSDRIPIPAFTVDDQVYSQIPTMVVATVDKFARIPFEPRSAQLFGNANHYHIVHGYYRLVEENEQLAEAREGHPEPTGSQKQRNYVRIDRELAPPDLVVQDELHLLEGPLGSMVGAYETLVEQLAANRGRRVKYVASTATIRRAPSHVRSLFSRDLAVFPPQGLSADDRFFVKDRRLPSPLLEHKPGRLYVGVCAPGLGPLTPIVRIWAQLVCTLQDNRDDPDIDSYWTVTGYFNAVRELAGARALYRQDIPERVGNTLEGARPRNFDEDKTLELSSRTPSTELPNYLRYLAKASKDAGPDALFTTSMFGTGVDVDRIGTMIVNGQPKTSSSYIQATGRAGRRRGALVITFYRASRPRDLNHYEFFSTHHQQLHRFVEPPAVFPFAKGVMEHTLGPVMVGLLRNKRTWRQWAPNKRGAGIMETRSGSDEIRNIRSMIRDRAAEQPEQKRPGEIDVDRTVESGIEMWREAAASNHNDLWYREYGRTEHPIVLGDPEHLRDDRSPVYEKVPNSLRSVEEETEFET